MKLLLGNTFYWHMLQCHIIRWLLNHDPNERPTSKELLQSEYVPPPQMEEAELNEILRSTICDPSSKSYHRMIAALFNQNVRLADDHLYDSDLHKVNNCSHVYWISSVTKVSFFCYCQFNSSCWCDCDSSGHYQWVFSLTTSKLLCDTCVTDKTKH